MDGTDLLAIVHVAPSAASQLFKAAFGICAVLWAANRVRHTGRSFLSMAAIALGFGFAGFLALLIGAALLLAVLHEPYSDSALPCLGILLVCTQTWLAMEWINSPPKRWRL